MNTNSIKQSISSYMHNLPSKNIDSLRLTKLISAEQEAFSKQINNTPASDQPAKSQLSQGIHNLTNLSQDLGFLNSRRKIESLYTAQHLIITSIDAHGKPAEYVPHGILYASINGKKLPVPKPIITSALKGMLYLANTALKLKAIDSQD